MEGGTIASFPSAVSSLNAALSSLPPTLTSANLTLLTSLLSTLSSDLSPALPSLSALQQETLLTNTTYLSSALSTLDSSLLSQLPSADVADAPSPRDLVSLIEIGATRYDIMTVWAPEVWGIVIAYGIAAGLKVAIEVLTRRKVVSRAQEALMTEGREKGEDNFVISREMAEAAVKKPAKAALGHLLNLITSTIVLVLQLMAWRLFVLPSTPIRPTDICYLSAGMRTLLIGYVCDLLFGDLRPEIYLHHCFTFALLLIGQIAAFQTKSPKFFRLAQYLILQATTEQTTYASMCLYHLYNYLRIQSYRPLLQRRLLVATYRLLRFTRWITFPQKIAPAALALYWLARMWNEIDNTMWGRTWIVWCTMILSLLMILQIKFCDDVFPLAAYIGSKLHGGPVPPRQGPVMRLLCSPFRRRGHGGCTQKHGGRGLDSGIELGLGSGFGTATGASGSVTPEDREKQDGGSGVVELDERERLFVDTNEVPSRRHTIDVPSPLSSTAHFRPLSLANEDEFGTSFGTALEAKPQQQQRERVPSNASVQTATVSPTALPELSYR
ncbi:hypothetical protein JCM11251_000259 [Rhodosporidiobolus azoricus]